MFSNLAISYNCYPEYKGHYNCQIHIILEWSINNYHQPVDML